MNIIGKVQNAVVPAITANNSAQKINFGKIQDTFEMSEEGKLKEALNKAFKFCQKSVMGENPVESQMAFDKTGKVLYTNIGSKSSCPVEFDKLTAGSTAIHSHPDACSFSIEDIMILATTPNLQKIGSIDPMGRTCYMEKPETFITPGKEKIIGLYTHFNSLLRQYWEEAIGLAENPKLICLEKNEKFLMEFYNCNSIEELYQKLNFQKTGNIDEDFSRINSVFYGNDIWNLGENRPKPFGEWNPEGAVQALRIDEIKATQEGIEISNKLIQSIADILGFKYTSGQI